MAVGAEEGEVPGEEALWKRKDEERGRAKDARPVSDRFPDDKDDAQMKIRSKSLFGRGAKAVNLMFAGLIRASLPLSLSRPTHLDVCFDSLSSCS